MQSIVGEIVAGSGNAWTLAYTPVPNSLALYAGGNGPQTGRLAAGQDYTINGTAIVTVSSFTAGTLIADYTQQTTTNIVAPLNDRLSPQALTTLQRVKDLLWDPNNIIAITGTTASGSPVVSSVTAPSGKTIRFGQVIYGAGIPNGTTIATINSANQITLSRNCTQTNSGQTLYVVDQPTAFDSVLTRQINSVSRYIATECGRTYGFVQQTYTNETYSIDNPRQSFLLLRNTPVFSISSLQYRAGTPTNPSWTDFIADQYELVDPHTDPISGLVWHPSGMVRVYGVLPGIYSNSIRATYVAGYPVDWPNAGNDSTHLLPADLTGLAENLVVRRFKRRDLAGKSTQSLDGANTAWRNEIDAEDLDMIGQYKQLNF